MWWSDVKKTDRQGHPNGRRSPGLQSLGYPLRWVFGYLENPAETSGTPQRRPPH